VYYLKAATASELSALVQLFERGPVSVLTGAGLSTQSGIPDYRGPETRRRARNPLQHREFVHSAAARRRYWARSMLGWPRMAQARPNVGHDSLSRLEARGLVRGIITQNVDGLHALAGARELVELHGALRETICLACGTLHARADVQRALEQLNPDFRERVASLAPDGDADLEDQDLAGFRLRDCSCGGPLKPHVVFFGEGVPAMRVARALSLVEQSSALLVVGSSLAVYSGLRFVHAASRLGIPVALVTLGETRADNLADLRIDAGAGPTLQALTQTLAP
jgi:NAD-dependent SIR2 family protein deacetylase